MELSVSLNNLKEKLEKYGIAVKKYKNKLIIEAGERVCVLKRARKKNGVKLKILSRKPINLGKIGLDAKRVKKGGIEIISS